MLNRMQTRVKSAKFLADWIIMTMAVNSHISDDDDDDDDDEDEDDDDSQLQ